MPHTAPPPHILVVDDSEPTRMLVRKLLSHLYTVSTATNGAECLDALAEQDFSMVLLDLNMPVKSGFDVLEELHNNPKPAQPPIIVVSASSEPETISRALKLGAADYVSTPFNKDELLARVATHIQLHNRELLLERRVTERTRKLQESNQRLKETNAQLIQAEKMASLGQLAAGVAHEINNPVGFIGVNLESLNHYLSDFTTLLEKYQDTTKNHLQGEIKKECLELNKRLNIDFLIEDSKQLINDSLDGTKRVKQIVKDLKGFSHPDQELYQDVNIHDLIDSTLNIVNYQIKYNTEIKKRYSELPKIRCCAAQINQVLLNLLVNASQAIETRGIVNITTALTDAEHIAITITDNGSGIPQDIMKNIFDPFFTTKPVGQGTGLGLSVSFGIIQQHGGHISVTSDTGNTSFSIHLPISPPPRDQNNDSENSISAS